MFEIAFGGDSYSTSDFKVARAILKFALESGYNTRIILDGKEITLSAFNQIPVFC